MMKRRIGRITLSMIMSALMVLTMPLTALAGEWDIAEGDIAVNITSETEQNVSQGSRSENDTNPTITGTSTEHTVTIRAETGTTATVTLDSVDITSSSGNAPISTQGGGNVTIELDGDSKVQASSSHAGIEKNNNGNLTITDSSGSSETAGSIEAIGGYRSAGIGCGITGDGSNITIDGHAKVTAHGGDFGAGIGGGSFGSGSDIIIQDNSYVISIGGDEGGAGIGSGEYGTATNITIRDNANVHVAGGLYNGFYGAGIGNGAVFVANGTEVVDDSNLTTGSITIYEPGTTVDQIKAYIEQAQSQSSGQQDPGGSSQQVQSGSGQQNPPSAPTSTNIVVDNTETAPPEIPSSHGGSSHSSDNNGGSVNTATPTNEYAIFVTALNNQIENYIKQLEEAIKSGNTEKANAMIKEGLKLNLGNFVGLNRRTITLLEEVSKAGIATTIDFTYKNIGYRTLIPANAEITPTSLLNKDGYCGALKLMKEYGRIEENNSPSDIG